MIALALAAMVCGILEDGRDQEIAGRLWEAGFSYEQASCPAGEARVLCRLLEEALYAGHSCRAHWLLTDLEPMLEEVDLELAEYWHARLAWTAGLDSTARAMLAAVDGGPWLRHRARGTMLLYSGMPGEAALEFQMSMDSASTVRRRYYSALDLSYALLASGMTEDAAPAIRHLEAAFPGEGLPRLQEALLCWRSGMPARAATILDSLSSAETSSMAVRDMASRLLEELE